jgi:hypothetical protein
VLSNISTGGSSGQVVDLVVGARNDDRQSPNAGAVYILTVDVENGDLVAHYKVREANEHR